MPYKVVTLDRKSYNAHHILMYGPSKIKEWHASPYILEYKKGTIVRAAENSIGIMVFKNKKHAENFMQIDTWSLQIIKVKGIGELTKVGMVGLVDIGKINLYYEYFDEHKGQYKSEFLNGWQTVPKGTVCYPAVEVLE